MSFCKINKTENAFQSVTMRKLKISFSRHSETFKAENHSLHGFSSTHLVTWTETRAWTQSGHRARTYRKILNFSKYVTFHWRFLATVRKGKFGIFPTHFSCVHPQLESGPNAGDRASPRTRWQEYSRTPNFSVKLLYSEKQQYILLL